MCEYKLSSDNVPIGDLERMGVRIKDERPVCLLKTRKGVRDVACGSGGGCPLNQTAESAPKGVVLRDV